MEYIQRQLLLIGSVMRMLFVHFDYAHFRDVTSANRPEGIVPVPKGLEAFSNVLVVFTCVESNDTDNTISLAADLIIKEWERCGKPDALSIQPFAHLSNDLKSKESSYQILKNIHDIVKVTVLNTSLGSFGFNKSATFFCSSKSYPGSIAFREIDISTPNRSSKKG